MKELRLEASLENVVKVQEFVNSVLRDYELSAKTKNEINIVVEEIFVNIVQYAYAPGRGEVIVECEVEFEKTPIVSICFMDWGKVFNPLEKKGVDVTLAAEERPIGGLGIFMVKKMMDEVSYRYEEHKNIFTVRKKI